MFEWLLYGPVFFAGIYLAIQLMASLFRVIDLWYRPNHQLPENVALIAAWTGILWLFWWLLDRELRQVFVMGALFFLLFHVSVFWLCRILVNFALYRQRKALAEKSVDCFTKEAGIE